ncbi:hypothetical protein Ait01nite_079120 [Actinoplanes italicus]|uniref:NACHT domain-containing protein n=2 Tax=Actinoplanes italicus TaxID=113567 RepID=A0A2T0JND1_9ACTN|nr:NACHT domain-containing protein [Actinoplanes italicus]PRX09138.1 NACHT domain-containing protein [Actinoplanes italicus]GIE34867.1 hypothetical protein Ait01nite_079120 [Actinoplanes italicus]
MAQLGSFLDTGDKIASIVGAVCALLTLWIAVRTGARRRRRDPRLVALLDAQRADSGRHRYRFFGEHVPALTDLYVRPRATAGGVPEEREKTRTIQAGQILSAHRHAVLLGDAGAGKSTFLAAVAGDLASRADGDIAVILPAADLAGRPLSKALSEVVYRDLGVDVPAEIFERPPRRGHYWRVLIDGLDEVVSARERSDALWRIRDLLVGVGPYRILVTSRPLAGPELAELSGSTVGAYDLRNFDRRELDEFAHRWFTARFPDDRRRADETADRFLARLAGARLGPVVRVPLLATIAAIVYEHTDDRKLPSSRASLYRRFVDHLLDGRQSLERFREAIEPDLLSRGTSGKEAADWLCSDIHRHVGGLLSACGVAWLADPNVRLTEIAAGWIRANGPNDLTRIAPDGDRLLRDLLLATGVCTLRRDRVVFVHRSFAEFLSTENNDAAGIEFDEEAWMNEAINPVTRARAAFTLARRSDADALVNDLLGRDEPVAAGDLLADGVVVSSRTRDHIVRRLLRHVERESEQAPEALRILGELSLDADVLQGMCRLASDPAVSAWARALVADRVADVDPTTGHELLRTIAGSSDEVVHAWIADALRDRAGLKAPDLLDIHLSIPRQPLGVLARQALIQRLADARASEADRTAAAVQLAEGGDLGALRAMAEATDVNPHHRVRLASALADVGDPGRLRELGTAGAGTAAATYAAAVALFDRRDPAAATALTAIVDTYPSYPMAYTAAARCADLGDLAPLTRLSRQPGQAHVRLAAARRLAALGRPEALTWLLDGHLDPVLEAEALAGLLRTGQVEAMQRLSVLIRRSRWSFGQRMEYRYLLAANGDDSSRRWLYRRMLRAKSSIESIYAAVALGLMADTRGVTWLQHIADDPQCDPSHRVRAASGLITVESPIGRQVLYRLARADTSPGVRLEAATEALRLLNNTDLLSELMADKQAPTEVRVEASRTLVNLQMGLYFGEAEWMSTDLQADLAGLARAKNTPEALRITTAPVLPADDARSVLEPIATSAAEASTRMEAITQLDAIDRRAAGVAFGALLRDGRIGRLRRWALLPGNHHLLSSNDANALAQRLGDPENGLMRFSCKVLLLALQQPIRVLGPQ